MFENHREEKGFTHGVSVSRKTNSAAIAGKFSPDLVEAHACSGLEAKREFLSLPIAERRKILQDQATKMTDYYAETFEDVAEADFDDYED